MNAITKTDELAPAPKAAVGGRFQWDDPFLLSEQLNEDERMIAEAAAAFCQDKLLPRVNDAYLNETSDPGVLHEMGQQGLLGMTIPEAYGCAGLCVLWSGGARSRAG
jgi:glutaryl-CoA dehydrogenase